MSQVTVTTKEDLKKAYESGVDRIRVEGVLADKVKRTMLIPKASFALASVSAGVAVAALLTSHEEVVYAPLTGGVSTAIRFGAATTAIGATVTFLGSVTTAWALLGVGVALGGLSGVKSLRGQYKVTESGSNFVVLVKN